MRNVILGVGMSLDGYIARPDGTLDFLIMPKDYSMETFASTTDTAVMGRKTLEAGLKMSGGTLPQTSQAMYVFSNSQPPGERNGVTFVNQRPAAFIAELREKRGKDIWLMGGGELTRAFLQADLVDSLYLGIVPILLGDGIPLFPAGFPQRDFRLVENKTYSKGLLSLRYKRSRE
jgi:dihydrofolate reductase